MWFKKFQSGAGVHLNTGLELWDSEPLGSRGVSDETHERLRVSLLDSFPLRKMLLKASRGVSTAMSYEK